MLTNGTYFNGRNSFPLFVGGVWNLEAGDKNDCINVSQLFKFD